MADDDVDVTLRLKASDDTKRVMDDMLRRTQDFSKQLSQGLAASTTATNNLTAAMVNVGKSAEEAAKAANQNTAALNAHASAATKATQASQSHAAATTMVGSALKEAAGFAVGFAGSFLSVGAAIDTVVRGYGKFAESQRSMERIQLDAEATTRDMQKLGDTIGNLSAITGKSGGELRDAFAGFRDQTGLAFGEAVQMFDTVAKASFAAGTSIQGMSRIAVAAMTNLKVPVEEMSGVLDTVVKTVPSSMMDEFASVAPRITSLLHGVGFEGKQTAEQVGSSFATLAVKLGSTRTAANTLMELFTKATDIGGTLGQMAIPALQKHVGDPDAYNKSLEEIYQTLKNMGIYDTKDIASKSSLMNSIGVNQQTVDAAEALHKQMEKVNEIVERTGLSSETVKRNLAVLGGGAQSDIDSMKHSVDRLYDSIGKLGDATGFFKGLSAEIAADARSFEDMADFAERFGAKATIIKGQAGFASPEAVAAAEATLKAQEDRRKLREDDDRNRSIILDDQANQIKEKNKIQREIDAKQAMEIEAKKPKTDEPARPQRDSAGGVIPSAPAAVMESLAGRFDRFRGPAAPSALTRRGDPAAGFGAFATGGEFTVPGSGRGDDTPVGFMATPGERVSVESIAAAETAKGLQQQQDKADLALQEHFARFRPKLRPGAQIGSDWPHDRLGGGGPGAGAGEGVGGYDKPAVGGPGGGFRGGRRSSGEQGRGVETTEPDLKVPTSLDPASPTGPAETMEEAVKRGYMHTSTEGGATYGLQDRSNKSIPASIRYNNPGAQWPSKESKRFGQTDEGVIGGGNKIAGFPTPVHGLASNIGLLKRLYVGQRVGAAISNWSGGGRSSVPGFDSNAILTEEMANDPNFWKAMHGAESGRKGGLSGEQIAQALEMQRLGSSAAYEKAHPEFVAAAKGTSGSGGGVTGFKVADIAKIDGGTAPTEGATGAGALPDQANRPDYYGGTVTVGGETFHYGSGGTKRGSSPYGSFPVNIGKGDIGKVGQRIGSIATVGGPGGDIDDPKYPGEHRSGVQIHAASSDNLDKLYTAGCFGIARREWPKFKEALLRENAAQGGKLVLTVGRDGRASIGGRQIAPTVGEQKEKGIVTGPTEEFTSRVESFKPKSAAPAPAAAAATPSASASASVDVPAHVAPAAAALTEERLREHGRQRVAETTPVAAPSARAAQILEHMRSKTGSDLPAHASADARAGRGKSTPMPKPRPADAPAHASAEATPEGKQAGGPIEAGKPYLVGEQGPELINPQAAGNVTSNEQLQQMMSNMREQWDRPIEPIIRPRIQQMGPLSMRWSRQSERQRSRDINRDQARAAPTDQGFA